MALSPGLPASCLTGVDLWLVPPTARGARSMRVSELRAGPKGVLVRFGDDTSTAQAGELAGRWILARECDLPEAPEQAGDLIGLTVHDEERGVLGVVEDVIVTGANDVLVVRGARFGEVLVPVIDDVVVAVAAADGRIDVRLLEGLIDSEDV